MVHKCLFTLRIQILVNFYHILVRFGQNQEIFQENCNFLVSHFLFPGFLPGNVQLYFSFNMTYIYWARKDKAFSLLKIFPDGEFDFVKLFFVIIFRFVTQSQTMFHVLILGSRFAFNLEIQKEVPQG